MGGAVGGATEKIQTQVGGGSLFEEMNEEMNEPRPQDGHLAPRCRGWAAVESCVSRGESNTIISDFCHLHNWNNKSGGAAACSSG